MSGCTIHQNFPQQAAPLHQRKPDHVNKNLGTEKEKRNAGKDKIISFQLAKYKTINTIPRQ
jgi:hypothetical protein